MPALLTKANSQLIAEKVKCPVCHQGETSPGKFVLCNGCVGGGHPECQDAVTHELGFCWCQKCQCQLTENAKVLKVANVAFTTEL